jgi:hypothetical protein
LLDEQPKEDNAAMVNITAIILSCLKAIPQYESTHNIPISLGPQWMNMAKDLLLTLLPSASTLVRRAAAEGLALLATLGVSEDAHFMQSTVLHSLDELMQGNKPDGKPRTISLESISASRSGALLTLASIQRATHRTTELQLHKARERARSYGDDEAVVAKGDELPLLQMITRVLPSLAFHGAFRDSFMVRIHALHAFALLLAYSSRMDLSNPDEVDMQLLRKSVELVEGNFGAGWTSAIVDLDRGQEAEKMESEVGLLAALLRTMTLLVPYLRHMLVEHPDVGRRFSIMAAVAQECHSSHPVICVESMAFFEVMAMHPEVMPSLSSFVAVTDYPPSTCLKFARRCIAPRQDDEDEVISPCSLRAAVRAAKALALGQLRATLVDDFQVVPCLLSFLEASCTSRVFAGAAPLRFTATSRGVEELFFDGVALEKELIDLVSYLLLLERGLRRNDCDALLRWLLFARVVLSGPSKDGRTFHEGTRGVVNAARLRARRDGATLYKRSSTPRWQVKTLAAQVAAQSLDFLIRLSGDADASNDPNFDYRAALRELNRQCRGAQQSKPPPSSSRAAFHLEELVSSACMNSVASLDHSELRTLQSSSIVLLDRMIAAFGAVKDPEQPEARILDQYTTQLFSSINHALSASHETSDQGELRLFAAGCDALETSLSVELTSDPLTLKRLLRHVLPLEEELGFFPPSGLFTASKFDAAVSSRPDVRGTSFLLICKVATTAKIYSRHLPVSIGGVLSKVRDELLSNDLPVASLAAAIAADAACFLLGSRLTLVGNSLPDHDERRVPVPKVGYLSDNLADVCDLTKSLLLQSWSACAAYAVGPLLSHISSRESDDILAACREWVDVLVPLLLSGICDADDALRDESSSVGPSLRWSDDLPDSVSIEIDCLRGFRSVVEANVGGLLERSHRVQVDAVLDRIVTSVLLPAVVARPDESSLDESSLPLVHEVCSLVRALATVAAPPSGPSSSASSSERPLGVDICSASLLAAVLQPLDALQQGRVDFAIRSSAATVVSTCLSAVGSLIERMAVPGSLAVAVVNLVLQSVLTPTPPLGGEASSSSHQAAIPGMVIQAAHETLKRCLRQEFLSGEAPRLARNLATESRWPAWSAVVLAASDNDGSGRGTSAVLASSEPVRRALVLFSEPDRQLDALAAVVGLAQKAREAGVVVALVSTLGTDVVSVLWSYGVETGQALRDGNAKEEADRRHRRKQTACSDSIRFLLIGFQYLRPATTPKMEGEEDGSSETSDAMVAVPYLQVLLECLLGVLRSNGLPNHPVSAPDDEDGPSVLVGRLCAQAAVSLARVAPGSFKSCLAQMGDADRMLVELAVRGEMSGYASGVGGGSFGSSLTASAAPREPIKKPLNAASFKRQ